MIKKLLAASLAATAATISLTGCATQADGVSYNLSQEAEKFQVLRRIVFFNGITDKYLLELQGYCAVDTGDNSALAGALEVTCMTGPNKYKKHYLGLSDNVSYFVEQLESKNVDAYHYQVNFHPEVIIPEINKVGN
jgi:uncharacterized lipoprotein NlpE involved in copper resistance